MVTEAMDAEVTVAEEIVTDMTTIAMINTNAEFTAIMMSQSLSGKVIQDGKETTTSSTNGDLMELATVKSTSGATPITEVLLGTLLMVVEMATGTQEATGTESPDLGELIANSKHDMISSCLRWYLY